MTILMMILSVVPVVPTWLGDNPSPRRADRDEAVYIWTATEREQVEAYQASVDAYMEAVRLNNQMQLTTPPRAPSSIWDALAQCESGGDWSINTGNSFYGGLQFTLTSWRAVGGTGYPHQHSREEQIYRAELLQDIQGWGAWPACSRELGLR